VSRAGAGVGVSRVLCLMMCMTGQAGVGRGGCWQEFGRGSPTCCCVWTRALAARQWRATSELGRRGEGRV
jgi:hypothetical protein